MLQSKILNVNEVNLLNQTSYFTTLPITVKEPFYNCSKFEIAECEKECRAHASDYFNNNLDLKNNSLNELNLFEENQTLGDEFCKTIGKKVIFPGLNAKLIIKLRKCLCTRVFFPFRIMFIKIYTKKNFCQEGVSTFPPYYPIFYFLTKNKNSFKTKNDSS
jgi:hypothetical protein